MRPAVKIRHRYLKNHYYCCYWNPCYRSLPQAFLQRRSLAPLVRALQHQFLPLAPQQQRSLAPPARALKRLQTNSQMRPRRDREHVRARGLLRAPDRVRVRARGRAQARAVRKLR
jgi:hypothetical protein